MKVNLKVNKYLEDYLLFDFSKWGRAAWLEQLSLVANLVQKLKKSSMKTFVLTKLHEHQVWCRPPDHQSFHTSGIGQMLTI